MRSKHSRHVGSALAIADYSKAIELEPTWANPYRGRGSAYLGLGRLRPALADIGRAIELNPAEAEAYAWRGEIKAKCGDTAGANADFDQALNLAADASVVSWIKHKRCSVGLDCE